MALNAFSCLKLDSGAVHCSDCVEIEGWNLALSIKTMVKSLNEFKHVKYLFLSTTFMVFI